MKAGGIKKIRITDKLRIAVKNCHGCFYQRGAHSAEIIWQKITERIFHLVFAGSN